MTVSVISVVFRNDGRDAAVTFEIKSDGHTQRDTFLVSTALLADMNICVGECDTGKYEEVSYSSKIYAAVKKGLNILAYGRCSEKMLCRKLTDKGIDKDVAREAVEELCRKGYIDPKEDAAREAMRCVSKLWGKRRIAAALYSKGYSGDAIRKALDELEISNVDYVQLCVERISARYADVPSDPTERRKLISSMESYGFSSTEVRDAFRVIAEKNV